MEEIPYSVYTKSCPNCGNDITADRLYKGSVCESCLEDDLKFEDIRNLIEVLYKNNRLIKLKVLRNIFNEYNNIEKIFQIALNSKPLGPQRSWVIRFLRGESFAIVAPPGLGKTTFGLLMSIYNAMNGKKSIMIFPTRTLVLQAKDKLSKFSDAVSQPLQILYNKQSSDNKNENILKELVKGNFDIFLTTSRYLIKNLEDLLNVDFNFIFVDDVDAALKSSKSANSILRLIGFSEDDIQRVKSLLRENIEDEQKFGKIQEIRASKLGNRTVIFSSATISRGNPTLSALMGFRPGGSIIYLRNIVDSYINLNKTCDNQLNEECIIEILIKLIKRLRDGTLVYVPIEKGASYADKLASILSSHGINAVSILSSSISKLEDFERESIDVLVGVATHYGVLVRGIDLPWRIKYAVFVGIPKFKFKIGETVHPLVLTRLLSIISLIKNDEELRKILGHIRRRLRNISPAALAMLAKDIKEDKIDDPLIKKGYEILNQSLKDKQILDRITEIGDIVLSGDYILMPDYLTYIQASGRTSRLYGSALTTGLSVLLIDNEKLFDILNKKLSLILDEINWLPFELDENKIGNISLDDIITKISEERENLRKIKTEGTISPSSLKVKTTLLIVESPNKARTIANFFSKPSSRTYGRIKVYETVLGDRLLIVTASGGHVYDLVTDSEYNISKEGESKIYGVTVKDHKFIPLYSTIKRCTNGHQIVQDIQTDKCPICSSPIVSDKTDTVRILRELALEADEVLIGTDPDTEGEKIAWDIYLAIRPYNNNIRRAEFHEVTRRAITNAINNPREFDLKLIKAQIVRRIEDRWLGFKLSEKVQTEFWSNYCENIKKQLPKLEEKVSSSKNEKSKEKLQKRIERIETLNCNRNQNLSAGRVQTPVLGWVVQRYEDYINPKNKKKFLIAKLSILSETTGSLTQYYLTIPKQANLKKGDRVTVRIEKVSENSEEFGPLPPYTTDTLLSDSSSILRISASETMKIAQDLFELGLITYHRTDSTRISNIGISVAESYLKSKQVDINKVFKPRTWGEGGAHEAIRPTRPLDEKLLRASIEEGDIDIPKRLTLNHFRVYDLIFRRFVSSQLPSLVLNKQIINIRAYSLNEEKIDLKLENDKIELVIGYKIKEGEEFTHVLESALYIPFKLYSPIDKSAEGNEYSAEVINVITRSTIQLYTEGELVSEMKRKQIGRPSTYATIISTLKKRRYVVESKTLKKLVPTDIGKEVYNYLNSKYSLIVSEDRTSNLLEKMSKIEDGKVDYIEVLKELYDEIQTIK
ncbi:reverse gyrase [Sulfolobus sp. A20]|nr:reverse gyrase [Sulfolobus sp. A20]